MSDTPPETPSEAEADEAVRLVRRRFLLAGGRYVAPAVLASLFLGEEAQAGGCTPSCPPYFNRCTPFRQCRPGFCPPAAGGS